MSPAGTAFPALVSTWVSHPIGYVVSAVTGVVFARVVDPVVPAGTVTVMKGPMSPYPLGMFEELNDGHMFTVT